MTKTLLFPIVTLLSISSLNSQAFQIPFVSKKIAAADRTRAMAHSKQIFLAMMEFEAKFGVKPGEQAAKKIKGAKSETANDCFRQLIQALPTVKKETIFYTASKISKKPDNDIGTTENNFLQACAKGEVGFVYVDAPRSKSRAPLIAAPLLDATSGKFDHVKYGGKAVVLMNDGSVHSLDIDPKTGKILAKVAGKEIDILSKENPNFREAPTIKYPEAREKKDSKEVKAE